jgi:hypothetical protein
MDVEIPLFPIQASMTSLPFVPTSSRVPPLACSATIAPRRHQRTRCRRGMPTAGVHRYQDKSAQASVREGDYGVQATAKRPVRVCQGMKVTVNAPEISLPNALGSCIEDTNVCRPQSSCPQELEKLCEEATLLCEHEPSHQLYRSQGR